MTWPQLLLPAAVPAAQMAAVVLLGWLLRIDKPNRKAKR